MYTEAFLAGYLGKEAALPLPSTPPPAAVRTPLPQSMPPVEQESKRQQLLKDNQARRKVGAPGAKELAGGARLLIGKPPTFWDKAKPALGMAARATAQSAFPGVAAVNQVMKGLARYPKEMLQNQPAVPPEHPGYNRAYAQAPARLERSKNGPPSFFQDLFTGSGAPPANPVAETYAGSFDSKTSPTTTLFNRWYGRPTFGLPFEVRGESREDYNARARVAQAGMGTPTISHEKSQQFADQAAGSQQVLFPGSSQGAASVPRSNVSILPKEPDQPTLYHEMAHRTDPFLKRQQTYPRNLEPEIPAMLMENSALQAVNPAYRNQPEAGILNSTAKQMPFTGDTKADAALLPAYMQSLRSMPNAGQYQTPAFQRAYMQAYQRSPYEYGAIAGQQRYTPEQAQQHMAQLGPGYNKWMNRNLRQTEWQFTPQEQADIEGRMRQTTGLPADEIAAAPKPPEKPMSAQQLASQKQYLDR